MLDAADIAWLRTTEGRHALELGASLPHDPIRRQDGLRKRFARDRARAACELLALRERAARRFAAADRMFWTHDGLEQASAPAVARWRTQRFPIGATVVDLCCGIGSDAIALAERCTVLAVDRDATHAACTQANAEALGLANKVHVACADATVLRLHGDAAFLDPCRRPAGTRQRSGALYEPPLSFIEQVCAAIPNLAVKVSPAIPDQELDAYNRVEVVSEKGECKEAVLWFGAIGPTARRSATVLPGGHTLIGRDAPPPSVSKPLGWLLEPDPAVIRADLVPELAEDIDAAVLDPIHVWLTADTPVRTPFATAYVIRDVLPMSIRRLRERLRAMDACAEVIKRRNVPFEPEVVRHQLAGTGTAPVVVAITRIAGHVIALICDPPTPQVSPQEEAR